MVFRPQKSEKVRTRAFFLMAGGVLLWMLSGLGLPGAMFIQLAAIVVIVTALQYLIRFELSDFRYVLEDTDTDGELLVYKTQGKRDVKVAHIELSKAQAIFTLDRLDEYKEKFGRTTNRYNYCQKPGKDGVYVLLWRDGEDFAEIRFAPDEDFVREIEKRITSADSIEKD